MVQAAGDLNLTTTQSLTNSGTLYAKGQLQAASGTDQAHSGTTAAQGSVTLSAGGTFISSAASLAAAGVQSDGQLRAGQDLNVQTTGAAQLAGQSLATSALNVQGASVSVAQGQLSAQQVSLQASAGDLNATGSRITVAQGLALRTPQSLQTDGASLQASQLQVTARDWSNTRGKVEQVASTDLVIDLQGGAFNNTSGTLRTNAQNLSLNTGALNNTDGLIGHAGTGSFALNVSSLDNTRGRIAANGQASLRSASVINNIDGTISAQTNLDLRSAHLANTGSVYGARNLTIAANTVSNSGSLYAGAQQRLNVSGAISSTGSVAAGGDLAVTAASFAGSDTNVLAAGMAPDGKLSGTGGLTVSTSGNLQTSGQALASSQVQISAAILDLSRSAVGSTKSDLSLTATRGDVITAQAQLSTPGLLSLTARADPTQKLDNTQGHLSAKQLSIQVGQLDNTRGLIEQTGTGPQVARIQTDRGLVNTDGAIVANAQDFTVTAGADLTNTGGVMGHAGTGTHTLTAGALNNTLGKIIGNGLVTLTSADTLTNDDGLISAQQSLSIHSADLRNTASGTLASAAGIQSQHGDLSLQTQALTNTGLIAAAQNLSIQATHVDNRQGTLASTSAAVTIGTRTGGLDNRAGRISAGTALSVNTADQTLNNQGSRSSASQAPQGLMAGTDLILHTGELNNQGGFIQAQGVLDVTAATLSNQALATSSGAQAALIYSGQNARIQVQNLSNAGSQILSVGTLTIHAADGLNNSTGLVRTAQALSIDAASLDNHLTQGADQGLEGQDLRIAADHIDNHQGAIRASQTLTLRADTQVDNGQGLLSAAGPLSIAPRLASVPTLVLENSQGQIVSDANISIDAALLNNNSGRIVSTGDARLSLQGNHRTSGTLAAGRDLSVASTGTVTNAVSLQAGRNLTASALEIDNSASGEFISGGITALSAHNTLTNRGLIDGVDTRLNAITVNNVGTGRIFGDRISIEANTLLNQEETANGVTAAATIAARQQMDIGVQTLVNQEHALIFSGGDLALGGALDSQRHAMGQAALVRNASASIEAQADLAMNAKLIENTNRHFSSQVVQISGPTPLTYIQPANSTALIDTKNLVWEGWSRAGQYRYDLSPVPSENIELGKTPIPELGETPETSYPATDSAWAYFGLTPPAPPPIAPSLAQPVAPVASRADTCVTGVPTFDAQKCSTYQADKVTYITEQSAYDLAWQRYNTDQANWEVVTGQQYQGLSDKISAYNATFAGAVIRTWTQFEVNRTERQSQVLSSDPSIITAGGKITLAGVQLRNDKSRVVAGGELVVTTENVTQIEGEGVHIAHEEGTAQYTTTRWRGGFKRYHQRDWSDKTAYAPADVVMSIMLPVTEFQANSATTGSHSGLSARSIDAVKANTADAAEVNAMNSNQFAALSNLTASPAFGRDNANQVTTKSPIIQLPVTPTPLAGMTILPQKVPTTSLYKQHPESGAKYLVETDLSFTQYKTWLGSDYMTAQLQFDPATSQKRLGDGFYEQKLIREQVLALTGQRLLGNYSSDDMQYMALMNSGLTYAKTLNLRPGIALSPEQIAQLTSDMVWLVSQEVTLADGSKQSVLVPQAYVRVKPGDIDGTGALLAGQNVNLNLSGNMSNSGTVAGRKLVQISADSIKNLGGQVSGDVVNLAAKQDIDNIGGQIQAQSAALLSAGRDINLTTTAQSRTNQAGANSFAQTGVDRVAGLYVSGPAGVLVASASNNVNLTAAQVSNAGAGASVLAAGNQLNLGAVTTSASQDLNWDLNNYLRQSASQDVGSQINTTGNLTLKAGQDINAVSANVQSAAQLSVNAGRDVNITAGQASQSLDEAHQRTSSGALSSKTITTRDQQQSTTAQASNLEGQSVSISAGQDLGVKGSNVLADQAVNLIASGNVNISAAQNTSTSNTFSQTTKSGLMSGGGLSITLGTQTQSLDQQGQSTTAAASTLGAIAGNVSINAGKAFSQTGSDILTPVGDIAITAQSVNIQEARETGAQSSEQQFKQSGITLAVTSPVLSALQTVQGLSQAAGNTSSGRMQALAAGAAAINLKQGADALKAGQGDANGQVATGKPNADGTPEMANANAADKAGGIGISLSVGGSSSSAKQQSSADTARASTLTAGGDIRIAATGAGQASNLTVQGSDIKAAGTTTLSADNQINLLAAQNTSQESSSSKSQSASVGIAAQLGNGGGGIGVTASASVGQGRGAGNGSTYSNTHVEGQQVVMTSGSDTTIKGATVTGQQVTVNTGGNLSIQSLQDANQYKEKSQSAGGSVMIGAGGGGSLNLAASKINSDFLSVNEQSAIWAGDGGFNVNVQGKTELVGGQITSTQAAVDAGKNSFTSQGGTSLQDLQNTAAYSAQSFSIGLGAGSQPGKSMSAGMSGVGFGKDKGSASSTTTAGISGVAGNAAARTGDASTSIKPIFDADKVKKEIEAQVKITQEFNKQAGKAITDYANNQRKALQEQAKTASTPEEKAQAAQALKDVNMQERALNILTSALTGMAGSVVTKEALSTAAEKMRDLMIEDSKKFAGVVDKDGKPLFSNQSGQSVGVNGDEFKAAGARANLDLLCGPEGGRCSFEKTSDGSIDESKAVTFLGQENPDKSRQSYAEFLKTPDGQKMLSVPFGGLQGGERTLFGQPYEKGSWQDKLLEAFVGPHDLIGGQKPGLYDSQGNIKQGMSRTEEKARDIWSGLALVPAAPLAASQLPTEVWKALGILLKGGL